MTTTSALRRAALLAGALIVTSLAIGSVQLAALAVPFVLSAAVALVSPRTQPRGRVDVAEQHVAEGDSVQVAVTVQADRPGRVTVVRLRGPAASAFAERTEVLAPDDDDSIVMLSVRASRWGRHQLGSVIVTEFDRALLAAGSTTVSAPAVSVHPAVQPVHAAPAPATTSAGYAGEHRSRATGVGVEVSAVRPFVPGDRLRRVNWRATARTGELTVTTTESERSVDVVVVIDALHDVGPPGATSVDAAVRAASGIIEHHLRLGDIVGALEYGGQQRILAPAAGRTQLVRARDWLLDTRSVVSTATGPLRWPAMFAGGSPLVVVLTPLVDDASAKLLVDLRMRALVVMALDTLPPGTLAPAGSELERLARRLWALERDMLLGRLSDLGIPVVPWAGAAALDATMRDLSRLAAAPRLAVS